MAQLSNARDQYLAGTEICVRIAPWSMAEIASPRSAPGILAPESGEQSGSGIARHSSLQGAGSDRFTPSPHITWVNPDPGQAPVMHKQIHDTDTPVLVTRRAGDRRITSVNASAVANRKPELANSEYPEQHDQEDSPITKVANSLHENTATAIGPVASGEPCLHLLVSYFPASRKPLLRSQSTNSSRGCRHLQAS